MRFLSFVLLGAASVAHALISPDQLVSKLDRLTDSAEALIKPAGQLSVSHAQSFLSGKGPFFEIVTGLRDVSLLGNGISGSLSGVDKGAFDGEDADDIVASLEKLSTAFSELLDEFVDRAKVFNGLPVVGAPVRVALLLTKTVFDDFSGNIIKSLSGKQANDARSAVQGVNGKFTTTIAITQN